MTALLDIYRDDGPVADAVRHNVKLTAWSLVLTAAGALAGAVGLAIDGSSSTGPASVIGIAAFVALGSLGAAARRHPRVQWLVPPLLRVGEYATVAVLAWRTGPSAGRSAVVLLIIIAFHHYDLVYRLRHQHAPPSHLVAQLCGGWEGRTVAVTLAATAGVLHPMLIVLIVWCGALYVTESMRSWARLALDERVADAAGPLEEEVV